MKRQFISALILAAAAFWILFAYSVITVPDSNPALLERKINQCMERHMDVWKMPMDAQIIAMEQVDDRLYVAFINAELGRQLWGAIFYHDALRGWVPTKLKTGAWERIALFEDWENLRMIVIDTGERGESQIEKYALWDAFGDEVVYENSVREEASIHAVDALDETMFYCCFYDVDGNDISNQVKNTRMNHGYTTGYLSSWIHGRIIIDLFGTRIVREVRI